MAQTGLAAPPAPTGVAVAANDAGVNIAVTYTAQAASSGRTATNRIEIWRRIVGETGNGIRILNDTRPLTNDANTTKTHPDYWAPLNENLEYRVIAYDESKAETASGWTG